MFSWLFSDPLPAGTPAPDFSAPDDGGRLVKLSALRGKNVVLVFYPGDNTPGCTKQLCQLRDDWGDISKRKVEVFGVNPQGVESHQKFRRKYNFPFPLLIDHGQRIAELYHANGLFVKRTVYRIGPDGVIRFAQRGMPAPKEILGL
jgi:peroxiredoxin Q/BCP